MKNVASDIYYRWIHKIAQMTELRFMLLYLKVFVSKIDYQPSYGNILPSELPTGIFTELPSQYNERAFSVL